jgi:hypothetical protein
MLSIFPGLPRFPLVEVSGTALCWPMYLPSLQIVSQVYSFNSYTFLSIPTSSQKASSKQFFLRTKLPKKSQHTTRMQPHHTPYLPPSTTDTLLLASIIAGILFTLTLFVYLLICFLYWEADAAQLEVDLENGQRQLLLTEQNLRAYQTLLGPERDGSGSEVEESESEESSESRESSESSEASHDGD